jgi:TonB family protein
MGRKLSRRRSYFLAVLPLLLLACPAMAEDPAAAPKPSEADVPLDVPSDAKARGEHGTVVLQGDISPENRATNLAVVQSSGSQSLDELALAKLANARLGPDLVEGGARKVRLEVQFYNYDTKTIGEGYSCGQAVLDADWYARTFPGRGIEQDPLFLLIQAAGTLIGVKTVAFASDPDRYARVWRATLEACRADPGTGFMAKLVSVGAKRR